MAEHVVAVVILLFVIAMIAGFFVGVALTLSGGDGSGLVWSCGMPLMAMLIGSANSWNGKRK